MNTTIEICDNNTNITGTYKVSYKDTSGKKQVKVLQQNTVDCLLDMRQKERFLMGQCKFKISSEFDFKTTFFS
jgi:hypothetical protein